MNTGTKILIGLAAVAVALIGYKVLVPENPVAPPTVGQAVDNTWSDITKIISSLGGVAAAIWGNNTTDKNPSTEPRN